MKSNGLESAQLYRKYIFHVLAQDSEIILEEGAEQVSEPAAVDDYRETLSSGLSKEAAHITHSDYSIMYKACACSNHTKTQHTGRSCTQLLSEAVELLVIVPLGEGDTV